MSKLARIVTEYYEHIDAEDADWVIGLFAVDAVYNRADITYTGLPTIAKFFRNERRFVGGTPSTACGWIPRRAVSPSRGSSTAWGLPAILARLASPTCGTSMTLRS